MEDCPACGTSVDGGPAACPECGTDLLADDSEFELDRRHVLGAAGGVAIFAGGWFAFFRDTDEIVSGTVTESPGRLSFVEELAEGRDLELEVELVAGSDAQAILYIGGQVPYLNTFSEIEGEVMTSVGETPAADDQAREFGTGHEIRVSGEYDEVAVTLRYL